MADAEATDVDSLNQLIHLNRDAEAGFRAAAENIKNSELETLFNNYAAQHAKFTADLEDEVIRLRGTVSDSGTFGGTLHRGWMDLMSTLSGNSASVMLKSCENGEQSVESAYLDAADVYPTGQTNKLIEKQLQQIKGFRTRLARLIGETDRGVEFQKNE